MKIALTGSEGRIGTVLREHWRGVHELVTIGAETDLTELGEWQNRIANADTVVHLAAQLDGTDRIETLKRNVCMLVNVIEAAEQTRRFVFASSMWAVHDQTGLGSQGNYYSASKQAGEAILRGWSDVHRRPSVSLRLGHFGSPLGAAAIEHEMLRVDESSLRWWFDKAIAYDEPRSVAWQAIGLSDHHGK